MRAPLIVAVVATGLAATGGVRLAAQEAAPPVERAAERAIVVDAPDIRKLQLGSNPTYMSDVLGADVYGNGGGRIGTVRDFVVSDGALFAVLEMSNGDLARMAAQTEDEQIVVPWNELRQADLSNM